MTFCTQVTLKPYNTTESATVVRLMSIATSAVWALTSLGSSTQPRVATREATLARASATVYNLVLGLGPDRR